jgi:hypothetical protein
MKNHGETSHGNTIEKISTMNKNKKEKTSHGKKLWKNLEMIKVELPSSPQTNTNFPFIIVDLNGIMVLST